jgi:hypothetical protein
MVFTLALVMAGWSGLTSASAQEGREEKKEAREVEKEMRYDQRRFFVDPPTKLLFPKSMFWNTSVQSKSDHTFERAGCSHELSKLAQPTFNPHYANGLVGGGKLVKGDGPAANGTDGIFGWDYVLFGRKPDRVFLGFQHNRPHQMMNGAYNADKPRVFDVFTIRPVRRAILERQNEREGGGEE